MKNRKRRSGRRLALLGFVIGTAVATCGASGDDDTCYEEVDASGVLGEWVDESGLHELALGDATILFNEGYLDVVISLPREEDGHWALVFKLAPEDGRVDFWEPQEGELVLEEIGATACRCDAPWTGGYCESETPEDCVPLAGSVEVSDVDDCAGRSCDTAFMLAIQATAPGRFFFFNAKRGFADVEREGSCTSSGCGGGGWLYPGY